MDRLSATYMLKDMEHQYAELRKAELQWTADHGGSNIWLNPFKQVATNLYSTIGSMKSLVQGWDWSTAKTSL